MGTMWKFQDFSVTQILREINFGECRCCKTAVFVTVWIFQDFSVTQILREINFGESRSGKSAILGALNFVTLVNCSLQ